MDFSKVKAMTIHEGTVKQLLIDGKTVWRAKTDLEQLTAPTISLDGDILTMTATDDKTEEFVIFVDGVETVASERLKLDTPTIEISMGELIIKSSDNRVEKYSVYVNGEKRSVISSSMEQITFTLNWAIMVRDPEGTSYETVETRTVTAMKGETWETWVNTTNYIGYDGEKPYIYGESIYCGSKVGLYYDEGGTTPVKANDKIATDGVYYFIDYQK